MSILSDLLKELKENKQIKENETLSKIDSKNAGRILKNKGKDAAISFIKISVKDKENLPNFAGGPVSCNILAQSRPISEWPIAIATQAIQEFIYNLPEHEIPKSCNLTSKDAQHQWLEKSGLSNLEFKDVQGRNKIFNNAIGVYEGVKIKNENKNKKMKERLLSENKESSFEEKKTFDDKGFLLEKPSPNYSIFCYQQISPDIFNISKYPKVSLPPELIGYHRKSDEPLISCCSVDRTKILEGQPGYIPRWQLEVNPSQKKFGLSKKENKRRRLSKKIRKENAIVGIIKIANDWLLFDMRGLLRVNCWRCKHQPEHTIQNLLNHFTGDPIIDAKRNVVRFRYKDEYGIKNSKNLNEKKGKELLSSLVKQKGYVLLATVDVGQNNPIAVGIYEVKEENGNLTKSKIDGFSTSKIDSLNKIEAYRKRCDNLESCLKEEAIKLLSLEQQEEIEKFKSISAEEIAHLVCSQNHTDYDNLPWNKMTGNTFYISETLQSQNVDRTITHFTTKDKETGKNKEVLKSDKKWFLEFKPKLSNDTRKELNEILWNLKKVSVEYKKLSDSKRQIAREIANFISSKSDVIGIEKLVKKDNFFSGSGKRDIGWNNFISPKRENRWWVNAIHKALFDLAQNKGKKVILLPPMRTSQTCPKCGCCDKKNRDSNNREIFKCINCNVELNADIDVAVDNLATVAITGTSMPKPSCERQSDEKTPVVARKANSLKLQGKSTTISTDEAKEAS